MHFIFLTCSVAADNSQTPSDGNRAQSRTGFLAALARVSQTPGSNHTEEGFVSVGVIVTDGRVPSSMKPSWMITSTQENCKLLEGRVSDSFCIFSTSYRAGHRIGLQKPH